MGLMIFGGDGNGNAQDYFVVNGWLWRNGMGWDGMGWGVNAAASAIEIQSKAIHVKRGENDGKRGKQEGRREEEEERKLD